MQKKIQRPHNLLPWILNSVLGMLRASLSFFCIPHVNPSLFFSVTLFASSYINAAHCFLSFVLVLYKYRLKTKNQRAASIPINAKRRYTPTATTVSLVPEKNNPKQLYITCSYRRKISSADFFTCFIFSYKHIMYNSRTPTRSKSRLSNSVRFVPVLIG
jgi:hypothetical protein